MKMDGLTRPLSLRIHFMYCVAQTHRNESVLPLCKFF